MQRLGPRMARWYRKGSGPRREEGREKRADRRKKSEGVRFPEEPDGAAKVQCRSGKKEESSG